MFRTLFIALVLLLPGCREEVELLTRQDLAFELTNNRKIAFERFHYSGTAELQTDQTFEVIIPRLGRDTGTWWLEGDMICSRWANFQQGRELCAVVGRKQDGLYRGQSPRSGIFLGDFRFLN